MVVRRIGSWAMLAAVSLLCGACDNDFCDQVAEQLRQCCDKGPAELRAGCVEEAERLESNGDTLACETDIEEGSFERCGQ